MLQKPTTAGFSIPTWLRTYLFVAHFMSFIDCSSHHLVFPPTSLLQARLPEIEELQKQLTSTQAELTEAGFKAHEDCAAAAAREKALAGGWDGVAVVLEGLPGLGVGLVQWRGESHSTGLACTACCHRRCHEQHPLLAVHSCCVGALASDEAEVLQARIDEVLAEKMAVEAALQEMAGVFGSCLVAAFTGRTLIKFQVVVLQRAGAENAMRDVLAVRPVSVLQELEMQCSRRWRPMLLPFLSCKVGGRSSASLPGAMPFA